MIKVYEVKHALAVLGDVDRIWQHASVEALMKAPQKDQNRHYVWAMTGQHRIIRTAHAYAGFKPIAYPTTGLVAFEFDAVPRRGHGGGGNRRRDGTARRSTRRPLEASMLNEWIVAKMAASGIEVRDCEFRRFVSSLSLERSKLHQFAMMVSGTGRIKDADKFVTAMTTGIIGAGPKCWGFGTLLIS